MEDGKYDPIIDLFLDGNSKLAKVEITNKNPYYIKNQLEQRINIRSLDDKIKVNIFNGIVFLEKYPYSNEFKDKPNPDTRSAETKSINQTLIYLTAIFVIITAIVPNIFTFMLVLILAVFIGLTSRFRIRRKWGPQWSQ